MTILKVLVGEIDPLTLNFVRSLILVAIALPFMIAARNYFSLKNLRYATIVGVCMAIAITAAIYALKYSQASYVVILALLSPVVLVLLSRRIIGETINMRAATGITVAAIGAFTAVALPIALSSGSTLQFYPLATLLIAINCIFFPLGIVYSRKSHEAGLPLTAVYGVSSIVVLVLTIVPILVLYGSPLPQLSGLSLNSWAGIVYTAVIVAFLARIMSVASYEKIGSVATGGLSYLHTIIAILIPVILLNERLSLAMVLGGLLILFGVYLTERHHAKHRKHLHLFGHH